MPKRHAEPSLSYPDPKFVRLNGDFNKPTPSNAPQPAVQPDYSDPTWDIGRYVEIVKNGHEPDFYTKLKFFTEPYTPDEDYQEWPTFERRRGSRLVRERLGRTYFDPEKANNYFSYSPKDKGIYCRACAIFAAEKDGVVETAKTDKLVKTPFINFKKFNGGQSQGKTKHERAPYHIEAVQRAMKFLGTLSTRSDVRIPAPFQSSAQPYNVNVLFMLNS
ncbi:unnamed protein product [Bursaphelenchus xylophilus]|uniref:(pine wood nematode) hypothetical protein n=1 Tax=Bursaphelenchus xylophilus TaxID=6326 RepID=A0A1I7RZF6_BURXY|nr:unnamed protein product [Bursaphelenchus xylophilus]CAG9106465.1 unnamed protein product [Bursaphelenchus xylophilus]